MKEIILIVLFCSLFSCCLAQDSNSNSLSVRNIDSIFRAIKTKNKLIRYKASDSTLRKFYYVDKKSKELLAVDLYNGTFPGYYRFIYYFHKGELIKLYVIQCTSKKNCKKGVFYFSNGKIIQKEGILTDDSNLKKPFEFLPVFKSFISMKNSGG